MGSLKVAVLGCGPTGLVSAYAAKMYGAEVTIYSKPRKSHMFGAQYLHAPIPGMTVGDPVELEYTVRGTAEGYKEKVYGKDAKVSEVSADLLAGKHMAWDIRSTYDNLWTEFESAVVDTTVSPGWIAGSLSDDFDYVINTIPLPQLCVKGHTFAGQDVWVMGDSDRQTVPVMIAKDTVICNGEESPVWYRASNIFGYKTVEWPLNVKPPLPVAKVTKPLFNNCTCWPRLVRLGRFGMWRKGILVHHAFAMTADLMLGQFTAEETRPHLTPCPLADEKLSANVAMQLGCRCA